MIARRDRRVIALKKKCRDFRRYLKTLDNLYADDDVCAVYSGVLNADMGGLVRALPGLQTLEDKDRFILVELTHQFIRRIERETFGPIRKRGYIVGDFGFDLPKGETYTLMDVKTALRLR